MLAPSKQEEEEVSPQRLGGPGPLATIWSSVQGGIAEFAAALREENAGLVKALAAEPVSVELDPELGAVAAAGEAAEGAEALERAAERLAGLAGSAWKLWGEIARDGWFAEKAEARSEEKGDGGWVGHAATTREAKLARIQGDMATYTRDPEQQLSARLDWEKFKGEFEVHEYRERVQMLMGDGQVVREYFAKLVEANSQDSIPENLFWCRYFYHVELLEKEEEMRQRIVASVTGEQAPVKSVLSRGTEEAANTPENKDWISIDRDEVKDVVRDGNTADSKIEMNNPEVNGDDDWAEWE